MWINPMLTIWLYGTIFSLALIVFTLWLWYWRDPYDDHTEPTDARTANHRTANHRAADDRTDGGA